MNELDEPTREELTDLVIHLQDAWDAQAATIASLKRRLELALRWRLCVPAVRLPLLEQSRAGQRTMTELTDLAICLQDDWDTQAATVASLTRWLGWALKPRPALPTWQERYGLGEERRG